MGIPHGAPSYSLQCARNRPARVPENGGMIPAGGKSMLQWTITFLLIALIAGVLGFIGIAGIAAEIARILFVIFLVLFLASLVSRLVRRD